MKFSILHETTTVGAIAIRPAGLNNTSTNHEVYKPRGINRWYLEFSDAPQVSGLMEDENELTDSTKQFGDQTSQPKKLVWQPLEKKHSQTFKRWYLNNQKDAKPPRQSSPTFPPPKKDYSDFIIGSDK